MPTCPVCNKSVSIFQWDIFGRGCVACTNLASGSFDGVLDAPCAECGGTNIFATSAPALAYVMSKNGPVPSKVAPGLFVIGCADCGNAQLRFNKAGAASLSKSAGWIGRDQAKKRLKEMRCPKCQAPIDLKNKTGLTISEDDPSRVHCQKCNEEIISLF